jgi:hypothetical protein
MSFLWDDPQRVPTYSAPQPTMATARRKRVRKPGQERGRTATALARPGLGPPAAQGGGSSLLGGGR